MAAPQIIIISQTFGMLYILQHVFPCAAESETTGAVRRGISPNVTDSDIICHDFKRPTIYGTQRSAHWWATEPLCHASNVYRTSYLLVRTSTVVQVNMTVSQSDRLPPIFGQRRVLYCCINSLSN